MITRMQHQFCLEYLADPKRNATQAAIKAGYARSGAKQFASKMLKNPEIKQHIDAQLMKYLQHLEVNAELVITGILQTIEDAKNAGQGAWQSQSILRGYELLGPLLGHLHRQSRRRYGSADHGAAHRGQKVCRRLQGQRSGRRKGTRQRRGKAQAQ